MTALAEDALIRQAALIALESRISAGVLTSNDLAKGFTFGGERLPLINRYRGIFKPRQMARLLSIRTVIPRVGSKVWYDDQHQAHNQIYTTGELVDYSFMVGGADKAENQWLLKAMQDSIPIIYFLGVAPGLYSMIYPTFITDWSAEEQKVSVAFGVSATTGQTLVPEAPERKYALSLVRRRLHQATFREAVLAAYDSRCAISRLPEPRLLDAAHIMPDGDAEFGQPVVPNGLPMSKVHHAAYDANLIGIDADYLVHISEQLMAINDGPVLEGLKKAGGQKLHLPKRPLDQPDRNRLAARFELFMAA